MTDIEIQEALLRELFFMKIPISLSDLNSKHLKIQIPTLDFKKTRFKTLLQFLKLMQKQNLLELGQKMGQMHILNFDRTHDLFDTIICNFKKQKKQIAEPEQVIHHVYKATYPVCGILQVDKNTILSLEQVKQNIRNYKNNLDNVLLKTETECSFDELVRLVLKKMKPYHVLNNTYYPGYFEIRVKVEGKTTIVSGTTSLGLQETRRELASYCGSKAWVEKNEILIHGDFKKKLKSWSESKGIINHVLF